MKLLLFGMVFTALHYCSGTSPLRFDGFPVYRVTPETDQQLKALRELEEASNGIRFWTDVTTTGHDVDIMVPLQLKNYFNNFTQTQKLKQILWIENVQKLVDDEHGPGNKSTSKRLYWYNWNRYHTLHEIYDWMDRLIQKHPTKVTSIVGGSSHEGRPIRGVKLSFGEGRKGVFIESGIHAREWIAPEIVTYIINQLVTSTDKATREIAESRDWYIFPSVNPDGYIYSQTIDRLWRKTRRPNRLCYGVDANRNWGYNWMNGGASTNECSETYAGSGPFSEIETKSLSEFISTIAHKLDVYLGFHSYSQVLLIPFGHAGLEVPENNDEQHRIGQAAAKSLSVRYGTKYRVGNIPDIMYVASGGSTDWVLGTYMNVRFAYTYELRDTGRYGFLLPPNQIVPTAKETLDSIVTIIKEVNSS